MAQCVIGQYRGWCNRETTTEQVADGSIIQFLHEVSSQAVSARPLFLSACLLQQKGSTITTARCVYSCVCWLFANHNCCGRSFLVLSFTIISNCGLGEVMGKSTSICMLASRIGRGCPNQQSSCSAEIVITEPERISRVKNLSTASTPKPCQR